MPPVNVLNRWFMAVVFLFFVCFLGFFFVVVVFSSHIAVLRNVL